MIHLDTSFLVRALIRGTAEDRAFRAWVRDGEQLGVSSLAWAQFLSGPVSADGARAVAELLEEPLPFGVDDAGVAARLYNETGRNGSLADCMIAAAAIQAQALLATANVADFQRFEPMGLRLTISK